MNLAAKGKVSSKGWVVIPSEMRKRYGIKPGQEVQFIPEKDRLTLVPTAQDPIHQSLGKYKGKTSLTKSLLKARKEELNREKAK